MSHDADRTSPYLVMLIGLAAVSTAAIFIRLAQQEAVPSLVIAAGRLAVATLALTPFALGRYRYQLARLNRSDLGLCMIAGLFLGGHFALWISSLEYTSVVASVALVATNPLFVAMLSFPLLGERVSMRVIAGIILAFVGVLVVAVSGDAGDPPTREAPLLGNGLALLGALTVAIYMMIGRRIRHRIAIVPYIWLVYGMGTLSLLPVLILRGESVTGYEPSAYLWVIALGLIPQLIGHSSFNYALAYLPAALVSLVILAEPIGSGILAFLFFGEVPSLVTVIGSIIILVGVIIAGGGGEAES